MSNKFRGDLVPGSVDVTLYAKLIDSTTGADKTGIAAASVTAYYWRQGASSVVQITVTAGSSLGAAHSDGKWWEVDATNFPGIYRLDVPDAVQATGADWVVVDITATGCKHYQITYNLDPFNVDASGNVKLQATTHTGAVIPTVSTLTGNTVQTGDAYAVVNNATYGNAKLVRSTTPANTLNINGSGQADVAGTNITLSNTERDAIAAALWLSTPASETYAADGVMPNLGQFLLMIMQRQNEFNKSSLTLTVKKLDGSTTAATFTLSGTAEVPTGITRTS